MGSKWVAKDDLWFWSSSGVLFELFGRHCSLPNIIHFISYNIFLEKGLKDITFSMDLAFLVKLERKIEQLPWFDADVGGIKCCHLSTDSENHPPRNNPLYRQAESLGHVRHRKIRWCENVTWKLDDFFIEKVFSLSLDEAFFKKQTLLVRGIRKLNFQEFPLSSLGEQFLSPHFRRVGLTFFSLYSNKEWEISTKYFEGVKKSIVYWCIWNLSYELENCSSIFLCQIFF